MKILYKTGNLLDCIEPWILHGCNAQGVMGSGVAKDIREKYPSAYAVYKASEAKLAMKLGVVTLATQEDGKTVLYDQQTPEQEQEGELKTVFCNGALLVETSLAEIRERLHGK